MATYIAILRGINVSGQKLIKMDALKQAFETLKFANIVTYVQSGNVVFTSAEKDTKKIESKIVQQIKTSFGFDVPVIVLTANKLKSIIDENPFIKNKQMDSAFFHVTFLADKALSYNEQLILDKKELSENIAFANDAIYLYCPNGYGKTKLTNTFLENKLQVSATTRNWKTTSELYKLASQKTQV